MPKPRTSLESSGQPSAAPRPEEIVRTSEAASRRFVSEAHHRLETRRAQLAERQAKHGALASSLEPAGEPDWTDVAAARAEQDRLGFLGATERREIAAIDAALTRIDRGTYGLCAACREPIGEGRLELVPEAALCGPCATTRA